MNIRKYRPEDKERLREICRATAHKSFLKNKEQLAAVTILYNDYYTECEPENIFVATDEKDEAVGYILCSVDWQKFCKEYAGTYKDRLKKVCPSRLAELFSARLLIRILPKKYRTHLHIDLLPEYQHQGLGKKLMTAQKEHLADMGIPYLSVLAISKSAEGYPFYKKCGFKTVRRFPGAVTLSIATKEGV